MSYFGTYWFLYNNCLPGRRKELARYLPPSEVPAVSSRKRQSFGPSNSQVMETPSPILYKRSRTELEGGEMNVAKRLKEDGDKVSM